ncbi:hypothetical protein LXT21_20565 [Myxococcus sp. K38C18041901]|uniref:hypothetical protein n=1 Tax=Myxococcus guangdongensis TaxID=2906760 RepID=UPI0020A81B51|nr:hypothetical protein [Myxococcus guangdongensis]MCP3061178.1 hypothetical protein [Myxococcus guangdongensis]
MRSPPHLLAAVLLLGPSCASIPTVERDGFLLGAESWGRDEHAARSQAAFTTQCPAEQLVILVLSSSSGPKVASDARSVGVTGCGRQTSWVRLGNNTWALNSDSPSAP